MVQGSKIMLIISKSDSFRRFQGVYPQKIVRSVGNIILKLKLGVGTFKKCS